MLTRLFGCFAPALRAREHAWSAVHLHVLDLTFGLRSLQRAEHDEHVDEIGGVGQRAQCQENTKPRCVHLFSSMFGTWKSGTMSGTQDGDAAEKPSYLDAAVDDGRVGMRRREETGREAPAPGGARARGPAGGSGSHSA